MRLIGLAITLTLSLILAPLAAEAQQAGKVPRIGYLSPGTATANAGLRKAFTDGLRDHGWIEGKISRSNTDGRERARPHLMTSRPNWHGCRWT
jgi:hypothetical protein